MSGNFGWGGRDRADDFSRVRDSGDSGGFSRARAPYRGASRPAFDDDSRVAPRAELKMTGINTRGVDLSPRKAQKATKKSVLIVNMDTTGSMGAWRVEIFKRLALLFKEAQGFLGDSLEILFTGFGDVQRCGDPFEVAPLGSGPILDTYIAALKQESNGGGNFVESAELSAFYVQQLLDTSEARAVYFFTITDEGFYPRIDERTVDALMGLRVSADLRETKAVYDSLKRRMRVFTVLADTNCYNADVKASVKKNWSELIGNEWVVPLNDARRVVDVILGAIAKNSGQYQKFTTSLIKRQGGTEYGAENIATVEKSLLNVPGVPTPPDDKSEARTKSLVDL